jgi:ABC-2 type transport system permease protein
MNLVRAEVTRFFGRRFIVSMIGMITLIFAAIAIGFALNTQKITETDRAQARAQAEAFAEDTRRQMELEYQSCVANQATGQSDKFPADFPCEELRLKASGSFGVTEATFLPVQFNFRQEAESTIYVAAAILCLFGFVVGASFVGAEWTSGGITNLLLWQPRRVPVLLTKLATAMGAVTAIGVGYLSVWTGVMWTIAVTRGVTGDPTSGFWQSLSLLGVRTLILTMGAAAAGFALASLGRHTALALGVGIGYAVVWELGTLIVFGLLRGTFSERFRLSTYVVAWLSKRYPIFDQFGPCVPTSDGGCNQAVYIINLPYAASVLGTVAAVFVAGAFVAFQRRDVA